MSGSCCAEKQFDGVSPAYRRVLIAVIGINAVMFIVELAAGALAGSQALKADALDFAGDAATYVLSLAVIGASVRARATASLAKSMSLAAFAAFVLASTAVSVLSGETPSAPVMSGVGTLALLANFASVLVLMRWRDGDSNVRSVWLCSRNDAIGNIAVIGAGALVALTGSRFPDLIVAAALAGLFLMSALQIFRQAADELRGQSLIPLPPAPRAKGACGADSETRCSPHPSSITEGDVPCS